MAKLSKSRKISISHIKIGHANDFSFCFPHELLMIFEFKLGVPISKCIRCSVKLCVVFLKIELLIGNSIIYMFHFKLCVALYEK